MADKFEIQDEVRGPWRRYLDEIAPLRPELFGYCCRLTGNVWDGEDLLQDTLLKVFGHLGKMNPEVPHPRAYLIRAATHLFIDQTRRARLEQRHAAAEPPDETAADDPSQVVAVRAAARRLFLALSPQERAAVLLKDVLDFSLEETAGMLRTTVGAVKAALHGGRARLRAAEAAAPRGLVPPREVVDRFVAALTATDFAAIRALCLAEVSIEMVGGARADGYEDGRMFVEHAHFVKPEWGFGENPHWRTEIHEGEPVALGFRTLGGVEGLNEVWRFEMDDAGVSRLRLYCFSPDVLKAVADDLGVAALRRPYRSPG